LYGGKRGGKIVSDVGQQITAQLLLVMQFVHVGFDGIGHGVKGDC
jgi:hypothetical protein